jgi:hypothetical protein
MFSDAQRDYGVIFMDKMLKSILEMDKKSRIQAEEAEEAKRKAFDELALIRTSLIEKKLADAKKAVEKIREKELADAAEKSAELKKKYETAREKLNSMYAANSGKWIDEIYKQIIE